jgi:biotin transporter BioY
MKQYLPIEILLKKCLSIKRKFLFELVTVLLGLAFLEGIDFLVAQVTFLSSSLGPMMLALLWGGRRGVAAQVLFFLFESFILGYSGKWGIPFAPNSGYAIGILIAVLIVGTMTERGYGKNALGILGLYLLGSLSFLASGMLGTLFFIPMSGLSFSGIPSFIANEAICAAITVLIVNGLRKIISA